MRTQYCLFAAIPLVLALLEVSCTDAPAGTADLILHHGRVYTVDQSAPWAEAVAIREGRILQVGSNQEIMGLQGPETTLLDAQGQFVMPGFIEGHGHFSGLGQLLQDLNLLNTKSWEEIVARVRMQADQAKPGEWIIGRGWHQEKWDSIPIPNVFGYPYHTALTAVSPNNPVLLEHASGHAVLANAAAMTLAGITRETPDPQGGRIVRGDGGTAIGIFEENAASLIEDAYQSYVTTLSETQMLEKWYDGIARAEQECLRKGITSFQDAGSPLTEVDRFEQMASQGKLSLRLWVMIRHTSEYLRDKLDSYPKIGLGNGHFTCRALKMSIDGALGSYGAWLLEPYSDNPDFIGQNTSSREELEALSRLCMQHQLQMCTHAIGDRANREVLDVYAGFLHPGDTLLPLRWRIEHAQHLDTADIPRFGSLGVIASMQAIHCTSDAPFVEKRLGTFRARTGAYAWRGILDHGGVVTNGTDAPVEDADPIPSFYASVTRKRIDNGMVFFPEQAMTRAEAIYAYTMANAYAAFEDDVKGSLTAGKYADLIILDHDLMHCPVEQIPATQVLLTMVDGRVRYRSPNFN